MRKLYLLGILLTIAVQTLAQHSITGYIKDKTTGEPLPFASVIIPDTNTGATADDRGFFSLTIPSFNHQLVISFVGYTTLKQNLQQGKLVYDFKLEPDGEHLKEVVVSGTMKEVTKMNSPIPVEVYTPAFFRKNPTPNIFEALTIVNGVQPQLNCNVCNTGDIHINGMEGPYTMILIDGMPIVSSLSTVYGLAGIPNSLVKRIEIVKGPASSLYGSEAVGGLVNIITKDPAGTPVLSADFSSTSVGEYNLDATGKWNLKKTSALLGVNVFNFSNIIDKNQDSITDLTLQKRYSIFNKWSFPSKNQKTSSLAFRYVDEDRWGGQLHWTPEDRGSNKIYGESIYTHRAEIIGHYQLPFKKENVSFDYSYNYHLQDSYYGIVKFYAQQQVSFAQLRWSKMVGKHDILMGLPLRFTYYDDNTVGTHRGASNQPIKTFLPGIFIQDEIAVNTKLTSLIGLRYDHHNEHGNIYSPRISFKYSPNKNNTIRLSGGNGFRVVNLFTEDHAALTGAREVVLKNKLQPEQSWNVNANYVTFINVANGYIGIDASVFYTYFTNKIIGDFLSDPNLIIYDNLSGYAVSKGITLNTDMSFTGGLKAILGATVMDVFQMKKNTQGDFSKVPQLFAPKISGTYSVSYDIKAIRLSIDLTGRVNGPMHLPVLTNRPGMSPWYMLMNIQFTKSLPKNFEVYTGAKNLLNFMPKYPVYGPGLQKHDPFSADFDPGYNYAPVIGRKGFIGIRWRIG